MEPPAPGALDTVGAAPARSPGSAGMRREPDLASVSDAALHDARLTPATRAAIERVLAVLRLAAAAFGCVQVALTTYPPGGARLPIGGYLLAGVLALVGITSLLVARSQDRVEGLAQMTFVLDLVVFGAFPLFFSFNGSDSVMLLALFLPLEGALKYDLRGAMVGAAAVTVSGLLRLAVGAQVWDVRGDVNGTVSLIGVAVFTGVITGLLASSARRGQALAEREAQRAQALAEVTERTNRDLAALHRVVLAGIGGREEDSLHRMVTEVRAQLAFPFVAVVLLDVEGGPYLAASSGADTPDEGLTPGRPGAQPLATPGGQLMERGGPLERALTTGEAQIVTGERLREVHHALIDATLLVIVPIRVRNRAIGALIIEGDDRVPLARTTLQPMQRLSDQMGLVIEAARAFGREVEIAERYQELDRLKTDFVAITSHELRTPLTAILGFAENLSRRADRLTPELRDRMVEGVLRQARRLARLVDDLRTVSRIDAGTLHINPRISNVADVVADVLEATRLAGQVTVSGPAAMPVYADPERLSQVLTNLLNNAVEHGDFPVEVAWAIEGPWATLRVTDAGAGIPDKHQEQVFSRFYQVGDVNAHQRGSGLGLAIARELTEAMAGRLEIDRSITVGASFLLRLPIVDIDHVLPQRGAPANGEIGEPPALRSASGA